MAYIKKFQEGGAAPAAAPAGAPAGGEQDPIQMLAEMAMQALQGQDCQMAMQVCEGFVALIQQAMGGGKIAGRKKCGKKEKGGDLNIIKKK